MGATDLTHRLTDRFGLDKMSKGPIFIGSTYKTNQIWFFYSLPQRTRLQRWEKLWWFPMGICCPYLFDHCSGPKSTYFMLRCKYRVSHTSLVSVLFKMSCIVLMHEKRFLRLQGIFSLGYETPVLRQLHYVTTDAGAQKTSQKHSGKSVQKTRCPRLTWLQSYSLLLYLQKVTEA